VRPADLRPLPHGHHSHGREGVGLRRPVIVGRLSTADGFERFRRRPPVRVTAPTWTAVRQESGLSQKVVSSTTTTTAKDAASPPSTGVRRERNHRRPPSQRALKEARP
jgi:hypothetical protein